MVVGELVKSGIKAVDSFGDGDEAWKALSERQYDFIILDWKIPKLKTSASRIMKNSLTKINMP
jgi:DNA-binding response OmpR family regulator